MAGSKPRLHAVRSPRLVLISVPSVMPSDLRRQPQREKRQPQGTNQVRSSQRTGGSPMARAFTHSPQNAFQASSGCQSPGNGPLSFGQLRRRNEPGCYRPIDVDRSPARIVSRRFNGVHAARCMAPGSLGTSRIAPRTAAHHDASTAIKTLTIQKKVHGT
jgi:hypothetical protein